MPGQPGRAAGQQVSSSTATCPPCTQVACLQGCRSLFPCNAMHQGRIAQSQPLTSALASGDEAGVGYQVRRLALLHLQGATGSSLKSLHSSSQPEKGGW